MNQGGVSIIGGCGHVGLPLGLALAERGLESRSTTSTATAVDLVNAGSMPFDEPGRPSCCRA